VVRELEAHLQDADGIKRKGIVLAALTKLKQICDHPALFVKDSSFAAERSSKLERLLSLCEEMLQVGDKNVDFYTVCRDGALIAALFAGNLWCGGPFLTRSGSKGKARSNGRAFSGWGTRGTAYLYPLLKGGGTGLNLTGANHVVLYDRWWNPAVEQQAMDRAYRIGQKKNVQVHVFCCRGTLEEKVDALVQSKKAIAGSIIGSGERWLTEMDNKEIGELIALHKDAVDV
jgi:Superfamily II DNA/RNA helicases, SNF2 family